MELYFFSVLHKISTSLCVNSFKHINFQTNLKKYSPKYKKTFKKTYRGKIPSPSAIQKLRIGGASPFAFHTSVLHFLVNLVRCEWKILQKIGLGNILWIYRARRGLRRRVPGWGFNRIVGSRKRSHGRRTSDTKIILNVSCIWAKNCEGERLTCFVCDFGLIRWQNLIFSLQFRI